MEYPSPDEFYFAIGTRGYVKGLHADATTFHSETFTTQLSIQGIEPNRLTSVMPWMRSHVVVSVKERVYCADIKSGEEKWSLDRPKELHALLNTGSDLVALQRIHGDLEKFLVVGNSSVLEVEYNSGKYQTVIHFEGPVLKRLNRLESMAAAGRRDGKALVCLVAEKGRVGLVHSDAPGVWKWTNGLKGELYGEMSVLMTAASLSSSFSGLYSGCNGHINLHNELDGTIDHHARVSKLNVPVAMLLDSDEKHLFAAANGTCACFRADTLDEVWSNNLAGCGYDRCHSLKYSKKHNLLIDAFNGVILGLSANDGQIVWKEKFSGIRPQLTITLLSDDVAAVGGVGYVRGISIASGAELWYSALEGLLFGPVTIAASAGDFCDTNGSTTLFQAACSERKDNNY